MDARTLVSRLKNPYQIQEDPENRWREVSEEFPFFAHAQFLAFAERKIAGENPDIRNLSPFKQNPISFVEFIHKIDNPDEVKTKVIDTWEDAGAMLMDEPASTPIHDIKAEEVIALAEEHSTDVVSEDMITEQTNVLDDEFDTATSLIEKSELRESLLEEKSQAPVSELPPVETPMLENPLPDQEEPELVTTEMLINEDLKSEDKPDPVEDKSLMVMMSFMDWLHHFQHKTKAEQEEEREKKALKTAWQKEKLSAIVEEEEEEIPETIFKQAMESISLESSLISESLARLLAKQGKTDKAIDMYKKLSLRNPEKSAYFADLIKEIHLNNN